MNKRWFSILLVAATAVSCSYLGLSPADDEGDGGSPAAASTLGRDEARSVMELVAEVPDAEVADLDLEMALTLVAMPLSCSIAPTRSRATAARISTRSPRRGAPDSSAIVPSTAVGTGIRR